MSVNRSSLRVAVSGFAAIAILALSVAAENSWSDNLFSSIREYFGSISTPSTAQDDLVAVFNGPVIFQRGFGAGADFPFSRGGQLYKVDPSSGSETLYGNGSQPNYSVDGSKLVFLNNAQLTTSPAATYSPTGLTILGGGSAITGFYPKWSPDGQNISYNATASINSTLYYHVNIIGGACSACDILTNTHQLNPTGAFSNLYASWHPTISSGTSRTGKIIFVSANNTKAQVDAGNYSGIFVTIDATIAADGTVTYGQPNPLFNLPSAMYAFPSYSHDGTKFAFVRFNSNGSSDLMVSDAAGTSATILVSYPANGNSYTHHPAFSPDDTKIVFSDSNQILQVSPTGGTPTAVTTLANSANDLFPSWAPGSGNPTPTPTPTVIAATLNFDGRLRDRVGKSDAGIFPDGESDGTFSLALPPSTINKSFKSIVLTGPNGNVWDTIPQTSNIKWVVGISDTLDRPLFNCADGSLTCNPPPVGNSGTFKLFVPDSNPTSFTIGRSFTVTITFTDNSTATGTTTISKTQADLEIRFNPSILPPSSVQLGQTATYSIMVNNNGPETAFGVFISGNTPPSTLLDVNTSSFCSSSGPGATFSCFLGDIDAGPAHATSGSSVRIMTIGFRSSKPQQMVIAPSVLPDTSKTIDNVSSNNSVSNTTSVAPSVELTGLEVTQGVQNLNNSTPLVADRRTFVRAHVRALNFASGSVQSSAYLTARKVGSPTLLGIVKNSNVGGTIRVLQNSGINGPKRVNLDDSFYFEVPADWTKAGGIEFAFLGNEFPFGCNEPDASKDCKTTVTFQKRKPFSIRLFSTSGKNPSGNYVYPSGDDQWQTLIEIFSNFPLGVDGITVAPDTWTIDQEYCSNAGMTKLRDSLVAKRAKDCAAGPCEDFYFALVPESVTDSICGIGFAASGKAAVNFGDPTKPGYPFYPAIGIKTDNSGNAAIGLAELFNSRAHELGHNFGFAHTCYNKKADGTFSEGAGCAQVKSGDGSVVLTDGTISLKKADDDPDTYYGFDPFRETLLGVLGPAICAPPYLTPAQPGCDKNYLNHGRIYGPNSPDMMSYGAAAWISAYSYKRIFDSLAPPPSSPTESSLVQRIDVPAGKIFQINGTISISTATASFGSVYTDEFNGTLPVQPIEDWAVSIRNGQGGELGRYGIQITSDPDGGDTAGFTTLAPWDAAARSIVLLHNGQVVATRQASANSPVVNVTFPSGGETLNGQSATFTWNASDTDNDTLTYQVDYSADNGSTWKTLAINWNSKSYPVDLTGLAGGTQALIRVIASDGFNSTQAQSAATFTVPPRGPKATITQPENDHLYVGDQRVVLNGMALDIEDGALGDSRLSWSSNLNGLLGTGSSLSIDASTLVEGTHTITLTATDSSSRTTTKTVNVKVFRTRPVFPAALSAGPTGLTFNTKTTLQSVAIRNNGDGEMTWTATADQPWIKLSSTSGSAPANVDVTIVPGGLPFGNLAGKITVTSPEATNGPQVINVSLAIIQGTTVSLTGKVLTPDGRGLRNSTVTVTNSLGVTRSATTSSFGFFTFSDVPIGETYTIRIGSRSYRFAPRTMQVISDLTLDDFVGLE